MRAVARFDLDSFDEDPPHREEDGLRHTRARIEKTFRGDIEGQQFAKALGAVWAGDSQAAPPEQLDASIIFAPVGNSF